MLKKRTRTSTWKVKHVIASAKRRVRLIEAKKSTVLGRDKCLTHLIHVLGKHVPTLEGKKRVWREEQIRELIQIIGNAQID
jgi:hypothetical protein